MKRIANFLIILAKCIIEYNTARTNFYFYEGDKIVNINENSGERLCTTPLWDSAILTNDFSDIHARQKKCN